MMLSPERKPWSGIPKDRGFVTGRYGDPSRGVSAVRFGDGPWLWSCEESQGPETVYFSRPFDIEEFLS